VCAAGGGAGMSGYRVFLDGKHVQPQPSGIAGEFDLNTKLFGFQKQSITRALNAGKFSLFTECGSGKTAMQAEWARQVCRHTGGNSLILAPLAELGMGDWFTEEFLLMQEAQP